MMTLKGYDAWRLQGPADDQCPDCYGHKALDCMKCEACGWSVAGREGNR